MRVSSEFSKYAAHYKKHNIIQEKVAQKLISLVKEQPKYILDLGCGDGAVCRALSHKYKHLTAVDFAKGMLEIHPKAKNIECLYGNFNDYTLFENLLAFGQYDYIFSSSALQWSDDLEKTFQNIHSLNAPVALAIFTSNTFKSIYKIAGLQPILKSVQEINKLQKKYFNANFEVVNYKLTFESTRNMFRYIKQSGVSGSRRVLSYKQTKALMNNYPLNYLEFEVVFITSFSKS